MNYEEYQVTVYASGDKHWYQNGKYNRLDGPACEFASGTKFWYQNGDYHRLDGPAMERADGTKYWYQNGKLHRLNGPAREFTDGTKYWYIEGKRLSEQEFNDRNNSCEGKIVEVEGKKYKLIAI
jgi:hypothetical protein